MTNPAKPGDVVLEGEAAAASKTLTEKQRALLGGAPDFGYSYDGDADDVVELYERGYLKLMSIGLGRYVYQRTEAGRRAHEVSQ